jgi:hypothetical protein
VVGQGVNVIKKYFSLLQAVRQNKLVCLSWEFFQASLRLFKAMNQWARWLNGDKKVTRYDLRLIRYQMSSSRENIV